MKDASNDFEMSFRSFPIFFDFARLFPDVSGTILGPIWDHWDHSGVSGGPRGLNEKRLAVETKRTFVTEWVGRGSIPTISKPIDAARSADLKIRGFSDFCSQYVLSK